MNVLFHTQIPKDTAFLNEDVYQFAIDNNRIAVSDGASESFDSRTWAQVLTNQFVISPHVESSWLNEAIAKYVVQFERSEMSWSKQTAFNKGSFATLLGIEYFKEDQKLHVLSVGDSLAILLFIAFTDMECVFIR